MLASPGSEPVRKTEKIRFVDGVQHLDRGPLDDLVLQHRHSERSLPPVGLGDIHPTHRLRSVRSSLQPFGKVLEIPILFFPVVPPRFPVHARRGFLLQREVGHAQSFRVVDVVQERREPQLLILLCCLTYPLELARRVFPARCPGRVLLEQVPFGQTFSLHPLRSWLPGIVRRLPRYCRSVRLPWSVRHRRASLDFPMRPKATAALGRPGISRFPREVSACVHGVSDRAGLWHTSRYRCTRWSLPHTPTASASRSEFLTRLNTRPARSPVNASTPPSRAAPHDSGPMWVATPLSCDFFIHYNLAGLTGAQEQSDEKRSGGEDIPGVGGCFLAIGHVNNFGDDAGAGREYGVGSGQRERPVRCGPVRRRAYAGRGAHRRVTGDEDGRRWKFQFPDCPRGKLPAPGNDDGIQIVCRGWNFGPRRGADESRGDSYGRRHIRENRGNRGCANRGYRDGQRGQYGYRQTVERTAVDQSAVHAAREPRAGCSLCAGPESRLRFQLRGAVQRERRTQ